MNLKQTKAEWIAIERPLDPSEQSIISLIMNIRTLMCGEVSHLHFEDF